MNQAVRRIYRDIEKIRKQEDEAIMVDWDQSNVYYVKALIEGPEGTAWEGGIFQLQLKYTEQYPNKCPAVVFKSQIFHPNVYGDGRICLDILNTQWSPVYDTWAILISIRSLLGNPNPQSPANKIACDIFLNNKIQYQMKVKECVSISIEDQGDEEMQKKQNI